jgi:hypothetical protein
MTLVRILALLCLLAPAAISAAQESHSAGFYRHQVDSLKSLYSFINFDSNRISGDTSGLMQFFAKLDRIGKGSGEQVVVVHIGDSHIQPGTVTLPLREWLQSTFGNAGPGMMFPYRVAKSNGPSGYISRCDTPWTYTRNALPQRTLPTGIAGFTLQSSESSPSFTIEFTSPVYSGYDASRLVLFHEDRDSCYRFTVSNEMNGRPYPAADSSLPFRTTFLIDDQPVKIRIRANRTSKSQSSATFYGMSLESACPGVIVHTIGVNGAMFSSYLASEHFTGQLASLRPDLVIVSLGTNEAYNPKDFDPARFRETMDSLFSKFRAAGIDAPVMLTTPPAIYQSYRKKRRTYYKPNPLAATVAGIIRNYADSNGMALWDWYTIMGGKDTMMKWKAKHLTDRRLVHFSTRGYKIQGMLLQQAVIECYNR